MRNLLFALAILLPLLAACSGPRLMLDTKEETEPPGTDEAKIVVYRDSFRNATKAYAFFDNEEILGFCQVGAWFEARVTPGQHFFFLHGVSAAGLRATLEAGKTYYLRVDSVPQLLHLQLRLTPIIPGMKEFDAIDSIIAGLKHREPIDTFLDMYSELHSDELELALAYLQTEGLEQCAVISGEEGR
jgi:hypothetical protein